MEQAELDAWLAEQRGSETPVAMPEIDHLMQEAAELRARKDDLEAQEKAVNARFEIVKDDILRVLALKSLKNARHISGFLFSPSHKHSVTTPKTPEQKAALFEFLKAKGIFLEIASVNSQTLNSLYNDLAEEAAKGGNVDFTLPGVDKPKPYVTLKMTRG